MKPIVRQAIMNEIKKQHRSLNTHDGRLIKKLYAKNILDLCFELSVLNGDKIDECIDAITDAVYVFNSFDAENRSKEYYFAVDVLDNIMENESGEHQ